ncbi:sigma-G-dependent sporulation-specific acid-soluble spore protein CsgA [Litchfieldia alkalitelluris]|uniref:sigma-G-dependent sporulation-specific acid-soluble spore protein CsgA n=1 Tax=Litchfieldia alkalitelluris TaxID=304268 RepID=UPI0009967463|nr:sigma-G-dependent sporulation-specific acid-soluble spore protein CsgA [Litchfieldia alkalitelluris]
MIKTLGYLRESVSNYTDEQTFAQSIQKKILKNDYGSEIVFVRDLSEDEVSFLNKILPDEIKYAMEEKDYKRVQELNDVYELLY